MVFGCSGSTTAAPDRSPMICINEQSRAACSGPHTKRKQQHQYSSIATMQSMIIYVPRAALPVMGHRVTNSTIVKKLAKLGVETSEKWIRERTGIQERRISDLEKRFRDLENGS